MGDKLDEMREVAAERASTIRELHAHIDYLERRIEKLEADLGAYTRMAVSLAQQQKAIATLCEEGRRLAAAAAAEADEPSTKLKRKRPANSELAGRSMGLGWRYVFISFLISAVQYASSSRAWPRANSFGDIANCF